MRCVDGFSLHNDQAMEASVFRFKRCMCMTVLICFRAKIRNVQLANPPIHVYTTAERDAHAIEALEKMSSFLGRGPRMIASALAPNEIIVVGDIIAAWYMSAPSLKRNLNIGCQSCGLPLMATQPDCAAQSR
jgi:hypothetical protein